MSYNLSLLDTEEKQKIELDKQASYAVWQLKNGSITQADIQAQIDKLPAHEQEFYSSALEKYQQLM